MRVRPLWMALMGLDLVGLGLIDATHGLRFVVVCCSGIVLLAGAGVVWIRDRARRSAAAEGDEIRWPPFDF